MGMGSGLIWRLGKWLAVPPRRIVEGLGRLGAGIAAETDKVQPPSLPTAIALLAVGVVVYRWVTVGFEPTTFLTAALVVLTAYYAWQSYQLVVESRLDREAAVNEARRNRSRSAAYALLDAIEESGITVMATHDHDRHQYQALSRALRRHGFEIDDPELRDRLGACKQVCFTMSGGDDALEGGSRGMAVLLSRSLVDETRYSLEAHIADRGLPNSDDFPAQNESFAWFMNQIKQSGRST